MIVNEIIDVIERFAPLGYQESYDNSGLAVGSLASKVNGILLALDVTPEVIDEALARDANLIVAHHPVIFSGLKRLSGDTYTERAIVKAIKHGISIYCAHTNIDSVWNGVNVSIAKRMGLRNIKVLAPATDQLVKLVTFVPHAHLQGVRNSIFAAGAGEIGEYDLCSFSCDGNGTFRAGAYANPFAGSKGNLHTEPESRLEVVLPKPILSKVLKVLMESHPYEEVAYDIYPLLNKNPRAGLGIVGELNQPLNEMDFLKRVKKIFGTGLIRHSPLLGKSVAKISICGGSGASLLSHAISNNSDIYITADVKYHQFFDANGKIIIADIGHYESEQFTIDIFYELLTENFPNFAVLKSNVRTNPINYL